MVTDIDVRNAPIAGEIPPWLHGKIEQAPAAHERIEIEVKFAIPRAEVPASVMSGEAKRQVIEQIYLRPEVVDQFRQPLALPPTENYGEWRVRSMGTDGYYLTAKAPAGSDATARREYEIPLSEKQFADIRVAACQCGHLLSVRKTRTTIKFQLAAEEIVVEIDDYNEATGQPVQLDFVICELEVQSEATAHALRHGTILVPDLLFVRSGVDLTGIKAFGNRMLAEHGFPVTSQSELLDLIRNRLIDDIVAKIRATPNAALPMLRISIEEAADNRRFKLHDWMHVTDNEFVRTQNALSEYAFGIKDSYGRIFKPNDALMRLDEAGKGWLRDYHVIVSSSPFLRLYSKPQVFRPGLGNTNTTTRGQHTQDVVACSMQLARQLGLNVELASAIAALHDIGHPAGGHIGEDLLLELSGRRFKHNIFSLSLADIFGFNLLREVQVGAFYHKSGGQKLMTPPNRPHEFGVVRVADKICYTPWDFFDAMMNGYLRRSDVDAWVFDILGNTALDWVQKFIAATVTESAEVRCLSFTERSGRVYQAYRVVRDVIYNYVHKRINWDILRAQYTISYRLIERSFPEMDAVAIIAYMTDVEVNKLAQIGENRPIDATVTLDQLEEAGFGFVEIIKIMSSEDFNRDNLYYHSVRFN